MKIMRLETTQIPNTPEGQAFAKDYQKRLRDQGAFRAWKEDTLCIYVTAEYHFELKEAADGKGTDL